MIFDVKMGKNFRRKAWFVSDGNKTKTPEAMTYLPVVSRDSVHIPLPISARNGLDGLACDIENAYITEDCREQVCLLAWPKFGSKAGKNMLMRKALYEIAAWKSTFRAFLAETLNVMGYQPSYSEPNLWLRPAVKLNGSEYYEYILCYVDDVLCISHNQKKYSS